MPAEKKWRHPVHKTLNFEIDRYKEFQDLCWTERKSVSEKIDELISGELQKKAVREQNPINVSYGEQEEKPSLGTLDQWIRRTDAIQLIKGMDEEKVEHIGLNMVVAARFKKTGIYRDVKVI